MCGSTGAVGPIGPTGPSNGPTGPSGTNGATGATGPSGTNGATGATGPSGTNGKNGIDGATGSTGPSGTNGSNGATGPTGTSGTNGTNGTVGATGPTGPGGTNGGGATVLYDAPISLLTTAAPTYTFSPSLTSLLVVNKLYMLSGTYTNQDTSNAGGVQIAAPNGIQLITSPAGGNGTFNYTFVYYGSSIPPSSPNVYISIDVFSLVGPSTNMALRVTLTQLN